MEALKQLDTKMTSLATCIKFVREQTCIDTYEILRALQDNYNDLRQKRRNLTLKK